MSPRHFFHAKRPEESNGWRFAHTDKELKDIVWAKVKYWLGFGRKIKK